MTEPLDFSKVGKPPPPGAPGRSPKGRRPGSRRTRLLVVAGVLVAVAVAAVVILGVLGGDDDEGNEPAFALAGYCELASELERAALETGAASAPGVYDGPPEAVGRLVERSAGTLDDLRSEAPEAVRDDVEAVVDGLTAGAQGDAEALRTPAFVRAASATSAHRLGQCGSSSGVTEGD